MLGDGCRLDIDVGRIGIVAQAQDLLHAGGDRLAAPVEIELVHVGRIGEAALGPGAGLQHRGGRAAIHGAQIVDDGLVGPKRLLYGRPGGVQPFDKHRLRPGQDVAGKGLRVEAVDGANTGGGEGFEHIQAAPGMVRRWASAWASCRKVSRT